MGASRSTFLPCDDDIRGHKATLRYRGVLQSGRRPGLLRGNSRNFPNQPDPRVRRHRNERHPPAFRLEKRNLIADVYARNLRLPWNRRLAWRCGADLLEDRGLATPPQN